MFFLVGLVATPDDYTRVVAGKSFHKWENGISMKKKKKNRIINQFGDEAFPHRINMAYLPINAKLLKNVVNNVAGFYLEDRFFFTPYFPSMSQAMVIEALDKIYPKSNIEKI